MRHDEHHDRGRARRPGVRTGYDLWSDSYDETPNPLVALDRLHTPAALLPVSGEVILDAGCGTGYHLEHMLRSGARSIGVDFSSGMLGVARRRLGDIPLVCADLHSAFPFSSSSFDAVLSALVSEHIRDIAAFCAEVFRVLRPGGRFIWSVFHPHLALGGVEANFTKDGNEFRLGAERHSVEDYDASLRSAGFHSIEVAEVKGDRELARNIPRAEKYVGRPLLLVYKALR